MRRILALATLLLLSVAAPATAQPRLDVIPLPDGFAPEGITSDHRRIAYVGSLADGDIVRINLRTGDVDPHIAGPGTPAVGLDLRRGQLWVSGGPTGTGRVYEAKSGELLADLTLGAGFINDVIMTRRAAYFTNSFAPELWRVPLGKRGAIGTPERLPLTGDWVQVPNTFGANGITATRNGRHLIVGQSVAPEGDGTSALYRVNPRTGVARRIEVEEGVVQNADGIELHGRTLYVVQNFSNSIAKLRMEDNFTEAEVRRVITDADFRIPTTATRVGSRLWAVNARFDTTPGPNVDYEIVAVPR